MAGNVVKADSVMKVGQRLIFFSDGTEQYTSRIEDITPAAMIVAMPLDDKRRPVIPRKGARVFGAAMGNQCQYRFSSTFKDKGMQGNIPCWWITRPDTAERYQNREYVRVRADIPLEIRLMDENGGFGSPEMTHTIDISGSGLAFPINRLVKVNSEVIMELRNIPEIGALAVMGRIIRCTPVEARRDERLYHVGVRMLDLSRPVRNRLIRYIFEIQRKELAKGIDTTGVAR